MIKVLVLFQVCLGLLWVECMRSDAFEVWLRFWVRQAAFGCFCDVLNYIAPYYRLHLNIQKRTDFSLIIN